jgi:hypothetical protein
MFLIRHRRQGRRPPITGTILYGSVPVAYRAGVLAGQPVTFAELADGPDLAAVVACASAQSDTTVHASDPGILVDGQPLTPSVILAAALSSSPELTPPAPEVAPSRAADTFPPFSEPAPESLTRTALRFGWTEEDLAGLSESHPGEDGGRSVRSGLTLAEMALTTPPPEWPTLGEQGYPWQSPNWQAPSGSWTAPSAPAKAVTADPPPPSPVQPPAPVEPEEEETLGDDPDGYELPSPAPAADSSALTGLDEGQAREVAAIIIETWQTDGKVPHVNKINFKLNNAGLPTVKAADIAAVIEAQSLPAQET